MKFDFSDDIKWLYKEYGEKAELSGTVQLLKRKQDEYNNVLIQLSHAIEDRDEKIESLINEKINYRDLYESTKRELDQLKDSNFVQMTLSRLSQQLKDAHIALDRIEAENNNLKAKLYDISQLKSDSKDELEAEIKDLKSRLSFTLDLLNKLLKI